MTPKFLTFICPILNYIYFYTLIFKKKSMLANLLLHTLQIGKAYMVGKIYIIYS